RPVEAGLDGWLKAMLLLLFAYGGYEAALNPMGEARNPQRDVAFALFTALAILLALYALLQLIVIDLVPDAAHSVRPLADAARAAVPVPRRRQPGAAVDRLPGGRLLPLVGTAICALLLTRVDFSKSLILLATLTGAAVNWLLVRNPRRAAAISKA